MVYLFELAVACFDDIGEAAEHQVFDVALLGGHDDVAPCIKLMLHFSLFSDDLPRVPLTGHGEDTVCARKGVSQAFCIVNLTSNQTQTIVASLTL